MSASSIEQISPKQPDRAKSGHGFWRDILKGAGLAFDPLPLAPAGDLLNDSDAFAADRRLLREDLRAAMRSLGIAAPSGSGGNPGDTISLVINHDGRRVWIVLRLDQSGAFVIDSVTGGKSERDRGSLG